MKSERNVSTACVRAGWMAAFVLPNTSGASALRCRGKKAPFSHSEVVALDISEIMGPEPSPVPAPN